MPADIVTQLRDATREAHQRLEAKVDIFQRIGSAEGRPAMVERFYGLYREAERALGPWLQDVAGLDYARRRRADMIQADLAALGRNIPPSLTVCPLDTPNSSAEALGFFYVLEGSTLGGRVIRRELAASGQDMTGLAFLDPYGASSGEKWRALLGVLRRESGSHGGEAAAAMVSGAQSGFSYAEACLAPITGAT